METKAKVKFYVEGVLVGSASQVKASPEGYHADVMELDLNALGSFVPRSATTVEEIRAATPKVLDLYDEKVRIIRWDENGSGTGYARMKDVTLRIEQTPKK